MSGKSEFRGGQWKPSWRVRWLAWRCPNIRRGEWLMDLGMPTPRAVRWKQAYEWQQIKQEVR